MKTSSRLASRSASSVTSQVLVDRRILAGQPDQLADPVGLGEDVRAADPGGPGIGPQQGGQHPDHGGLPGPVRSEQAEHPAGRDRQVDPVHRQGLAEHLDLPGDGPELGIGVVRPAHNAVSL
jgi:hypothetical protein